MCVQVSVDYVEKYINRYKFLTDTWFSVFMLFYEGYWELSYAYTHNIHVIDVTSGKKCLMILNYSFNRNNWRA